MAQQTEWLLEGRIIRQHAYGVVTIDDIRDSNATVIKLLREGEAPVHVLVDSLDIHHTEFNVKLLTEATSFFKEPTLGCVVYITTDRMVGFLQSIASQLGRAEYRIVKTREEALDTLKRIDLTLNDVAVVLV